MRRVRLLPPLLALVPACAIEDTVAIIGVVCTEDEECTAGHGCTAGRCEPVDDDTTCASSPLTDLCAPATASAPHGLCVCEDFVTSGPLVASAFDSRAAAGDAPPDTASSVAVNGFFNSTSSVEIAGPMTVAGSGGITLASTESLEVSGDLRDQGVLTGAARVAVGRNAEIRGNVSVGSLSIAGTLAQPEGARLDVSGETETGGRLTADVDVVAACPCAPADLADLLPSIFERRDDNDNDRARIDAFQLDGFSEPTALALGCGQYHFSRIAGSAALTFSVEGNVRIYVDGEIGLDDALTIVLASSSTLDLFVEDGFRVNGTLRIGDRETSARARVLIGGRGSILLGGDATIGAQLYAPLAELVPQRSFEIFGSAHVRRAVPAGRLTVHHDAALDDRRPECALP